VTYVLFIFTMGLCKCSVLVLWIYVNFSSCFFSVHTCRCQCCSGNSALHPSGVAKSNTSFGWGKGWNVTSAGWQVTLCDPIWHVNSSSGVATSVSELLYPCYFNLLWEIRTTLTLGLLFLPRFIYCVQRTTAERKTCCLKAKFHYASWLRTSSEHVRS